MTEIDLPESRCPFCGKVMDMATTFGPRHTPRDGDLALCLGCTAVLVFNDDATLRKPTDDEMVGIAESKTVMDAQQLLRDVKRHQK